MHEPQKKIRIKAKGYSNKVEELDERVYRLESQLQNILHLIKLNRMMIKKLAHRKNNKEEEK